MSDAQNTSFDPDNPVIVDCDDDESSVEAELQDAETSKFPYEKVWPTFPELLACVSAFASMTHAFTICDNSRRLFPSKLPTKWLRGLFRDANDSVAVKYSGYLYCSYKDENCQFCCFKVPYKLTNTGNWQVLESAVWQHNHDVQPAIGDPRSFSGIVHLFLISDLTVEHRAAIFNYLDAGLSVKMVRRKFREKFPGYEVRARVVKTVKARFLQCRYGGDRHQINELLKKLSEECGAPGGTCHIEHSQTLELEQLYFQIPMLREVGQFFGSFSIIDTTHNTTMYDSELATFNVRPLFFFEFLSILKFCRLLMFFLSF
jgi:hypothetical protein